MRGVDAFDSTGRNQRHDEGVARGLLAAHGCVVADRPRPSATIDRRNVVVPVFHVVDQFFRQNGSVSSSVGDGGSPGRARFFGDGGAAVRCDDTAGSSWGTTRSRARSTPSDVSLAFGATPAASVAGATRRVAIFAARIAGSGRRPTRTARRQQCAGVPAIMGDLQEGVVVPGGGG